MKHYDGNIASLKCLTTDQVANLKVGDELVMLYNNICCPYTNRARDIYTINGMDAIKDMGRWYDMFALYPVDEELDRLIEEANKGEAAACILHDTYLQRIEIKRNRYLRDACGYTMVYSKKPEKKLFTSWAFAHPSKEHYVVNIRDKDKQVGIGELRLDKYHLFLCLKFIINDNSSASSQYDLNAYATRRGVDISKDGQGEMLVPWVDAEKLLGLLEEQKCT